MTLIDTADSYGPYVAEEIIREALHPYPDELVIATKAGLLRTGPGEWHPRGRPEYLRQECEMSLRRLGLERIDLYQLHRIDRQVPVAESLGAVRELQDEGKIRHIGLSEVSVSELQEAQKTAEIVTVQNLYNLGHRDAEPLLEHCAEQGSASSRGFRSPPAAWPSPVGRLPLSARSTVPARRSSHWPGCCAARRCASDSRDLER